MEFIKMHGLGNDYVFVDCLEHELEDPGKIALRISQRHFSVGSDGLILILPSERADFRMEMYNADGSRGSMCGNGIRCLGKYVYEHGKTEKKMLEVETDAGIRKLSLLVKEERVQAVRVDMGVPQFRTEKIPVNFPKKQVIREKVPVGENVFEITCLSMGNPHCVIFVEDADAVDLERYGPLLERHALFPDRTNVEFVEAQTENRLKMRVWERGSKETYACGTGACAAVAAAAVSGYCSPRAEVHLIGGELLIHWDMSSRHIYMTGPAVEVCTGVWKE